MAAPRKYRNSGFPSKPGRVWGVCLCFCLFLPALYPVFSQEEPFALPAELLRPKYGESPRFPKDYGIGELGRGDAGEDAYRAARRLLESLIENGADAPEYVKTAAAPLKTAEIRRIRIGGGQTGSGGVSFLVRFLGREEAFSGELYLTRSDQSESWRIDDFILEAGRPLSDGLFTPESAGLSVYERFF